ncbi:hypothetical protein DVH24_002461, partial [Malus domestica]
CNNILTHPSISKFQLQTISDPFTQKLSHLFVIRKLLVMERVKVAPPKAMEMRVKVKYTSVYHTELYFCRRFGFPSQCSEMKNCPQLLFIGLAATKGGRISKAPQSIGVESQYMVAFSAVNDRVRLSYAG